MDKGRRLVLFVASGMCVGGIVGVAVAVVLNLELWLAVVTIAVTGISGGFVGGAAEEVLWQDK